MTRRQTRANGLEMGIRFTCPSGHKLHVKAFLAGKRGVCPHCGAKFVIPAEQPTQPASVEATAGAADSVPADVTTASIIIAVAEEPPAATEPPADEAPTLRLAEDFGSPTIIAPPPAPTPAPAEAAIVTTGSPAEPTIVPHLSRRKRQRRKQLNMAVMLLAAVILLALVLIWVLQRGSSQSAAKRASPNPPVAEFARIQRRPEVLQLQLRDIATVANGYTL